MIGWISAVRPSRRPRSLSSGRAERGPVGGLLRACESFAVMPPEPQDVVQNSRDSPQMWCDFGRKSKDSHALRMRSFFNAIESFPHAEERPQGASRSTHAHGAGCGEIVASVMQGCDNFV